jgi:hypothetical protein
MSTNAGVGTASGRTASTDSRLVIVAPDVQCAAIVSLSGFVPNMFAVPSEFAVTTSTESL